MPQSRIVDFYCGAVPDDRGRFLADIQAQSLDWLEPTHDYIQWLFPLPDRSSANPHAPLLSAADVRAFSERDDLRQNLLHSLVVMLRFYGLECADAPAGVEIRRSSDFDARGRVWLTPCNHNFLRISRILRSLNLLGCNDHARALLRCLNGIYRDHGDVIGEETLRYWRRAGE